MKNEKSGNLNKESIFLGGELSFFLPRSKPIEKYHKIVFQFVRDQTIDYLCHVALLLYPGSQVITQKVYSLNSGLLVDHTSSYSDVLEMNSIY